MMDEIWDMKDRKANKQILQNPQQSNKISLYFKYLGI